MLLLSVQVLTGQKPVVLSDYIYGYSLTDDQIYFMNDPSCKFQPGDIFSGEYTGAFKVFNLDVAEDEIGHTPDQCFWLRLIFQNKSESQYSFHIQPYRFSEFKEYTLYQKFDNGLITERRSGKSIPPDIKDVNISGSNDLRFFLPPDEIDTLFLRIVLAEDSYLPEMVFTVSNHENVIKKDRFKRILFGIFLGIMIIMILYHIPLYIKVHETSYLYYMLYILAFLFFFIDKEGYIYELIPQIQSTYISMLLLEIFLLFFLLFGKSYLDTSHTLKVWDNILLIAVYFTIGGLVLSFSIIILQGMGIFVNPLLVLAAYSINILSALGSLFLAIVPAMILTRDNFHPARFFLFANLFLIMGVLTMIIPPFKDYALARHSLEIGLTLQILTFSVGLGERINVLKRSREIAQRKIIEQLRENAALKDKVNRELEDKVKERTQEIQLQKEHIEKQNKEIKYSFDYAKKIQSTVLPGNDVFETLFSEHFIFFKPRDIVSGDFYWVSNKGQKVILTAADCTGHGVPGSLMSMLGITMLHEIVNEKDVMHSDEILNQLRLSIARTLKQEGKPGEQKDGIDMALMIFDGKTQTLEFSGANNPIYIIRDGEMLEFKGNNMPVAYYDNMTDFTRITIEMQKGDRVYMFTDGFPDQFGGPEGKKFKYRPFKDMLLEIHDRPMEEQHKILNLVLDEWKGDLDQIDDILIMGLKL